MKQKLEKNKKTLSEKIVDKLEESLLSGSIKMTEKFYVEVVNKGITVILQIKYLFIHFKKKK
jgi:methanogenic corrinoid protein MtbC1